MSDTIEDLIYLLKKAKENNSPKPIVFLGAGASVTGNIPTANTIVKDILERYKDKPKIKRLKDDEKVYAQIMQKLEPSERNSLLKSYIDKGKINVTHIYLAQLMKEDYIDYILTVNFDNLMLRALALYNIFPPTYDMAILKDLTTSKFHEKSVIFLHGQHHGLWLLNTKEEMEKVKRVISPVFQQISTGRPWIFIGYSGEDPILDHIADFTRFDDGLYWLSRSGNISDRVQEKIFDRANMNAHLIEGFDADRFMVELSTGLGLPQPVIIDKPFSALRHMHESIVDIDDKEHFQVIKKRHEISKNNIADAIRRYEEGEIKDGSTSFNIGKQILMKNIIDLATNKKYEDIEDLQDRIKQFYDDDLKQLLALYYNDWSNALSDLARLKEDETLFEQSFAKYEEASRLNPKDDSIFNNWGNALSDLAKLKGDEALFELAHEKLLTVVKLGGSPYNLACLLALQNNKEEALKYLEMSLKMKDISVDFVREDDDLLAYQEDNDFLELLERYS